jgi:restriction system protein
VIDFARRLLRRLVVNPGLIRAIDDRKFEELVATLLSDLGLQDVELTPPRKDGGKDIIAVHDGADGRRSRYFIECKHWVSGNKVTMRWAVHLLSIARKEQADAAVLLSTSGFGPKLIEQEASLTKDGLFLRGADHLARWTSLWERQYGAMLVHPVDPRELLELAT